MALPLRADPGPIEAPPVPGEDGSARPAAVAIPRRFLEQLPRRVLIAQLIVMALLGALHAVLTWAPSGTFHTLLVRLFDVDREMNIPTWFASIQWLLLSLTLGAIAIGLGKTGSSRARSAVWAAVALVACYLSADEVAVLHERLGTVVEELLQDTAAGSPLRSLLDFRSYYWPLVYAPVFVPAALGLGLLIWRELGPSRRIALLGLFVFLYAAVGLDLIEGRYGTSDHSGLLILVASHQISFDIFLLEEVLEMLGVAMLSFAFMRHLSLTMLQDRDGRATDIGRHSGCRIA